MKKVAILTSIVLVGFFLSGCSLLQSAQTSKPNSTSKPAATAAPKEESASDLQKELDQTVDDGGQADFKALDQETSGL